MTHHKDFLTIEQLQKKLESGLNVIEKLIPVESKKIEELYEHEYKQYQQKLMKAYEKLTSTATKRALRKARQK